jgi:hypothetical protein
MLSFLSASFIFAEVLKMRTPVEFEAASGVLARLGALAETSTGLSRPMTALRFVVAVAIAVGLLGAGPAAAVDFTADAVTFTNPHSNVFFDSAGTIGFAYAGNKFVGTVQRDGSGVLYSTDLTGGTVLQFAPGASLAGNPASEHFVTSSLGLGGFPNRDIYVASGTGIVHITNDGTTSSTFVNFGDSNFVRGILFDAIGSFGNDMLVTTTSGNIFRVKSDGSFTLLASTHEDTEGLDIAPLGAFGPSSGKLITASEGSGNIRAIDQTGNVTIITNVSGGAEELTFVPLNLGASGNPVEGFYGSDYTPDVIKVGASKFSGLQGDIIVTSEFSHQVSDLHFSGGIVTVTNVGHFPNQPEDGIFVTTAIITGGGSVPTPSSVVLCAAGALVAFAGDVWRRRKAVGGGPAR